MSDKKIATGGRVVIGADGESQWQRFYDEPLTKEEQTATAWFHDLSPNEQYREVRRMKWNLDVARKDAEQWKKIAQESDAENEKLRAKLATYTPEGFTMPPAAAALLDLAKANNWFTVLAWNVREDEPDVASLNVGLRSQDWTFKLRWVAQRGAGARLAGRGLASGSQPHWRQWQDAPSLKKITSIIKGEEY